MSFIGKGASSTSDEFRYWHAFHGFYDLAHGNFQSGLSYFYTLGGRPILALAFFPQFIIQSILYFLFEVDPRSTFSLCFSQGLSVIYSILLLITFFKVLSKIFKFDHQLAFILTVILSVLTDSNFYIRHLYIYDLTISLWFLLWLYFELKKTYLLGGFLIVLITLIYPAYWPMAIASIALFLYRKDNIEHNRKQILINHGKMILGATLAIFLVAILGIYSGHNMWDTTVEAGNNYLYELMIPFESK